MPKIYEVIAKELGISTKELQNRLCNGEPLVHQYYKWKYGWEDENSIPF